MAHLHKKAKDLVVGDIVKKGRDQQRVKEVVVSPNAVHLVLSIVGKRVLRPEDTVLVIVDDSQFNFHGNTEDGSAVFSGVKL